MFVMSTKKTAAALRTYAGVEVLRRERQRAVADWERLRRSLPRTAAEAKAYAARANAAERAKRDAKVRARARQAQPAKSTTSPASGSHLRLVPPRTSTPKIDLDAIYAERNRLGGAR